LDGGGSCSARRQPGRAASCGADPSLIDHRGARHLRVCGLISQAISTGHVTLTAREGRSSTVGLVTFFTSAAASARSTGLAGTGRLAGLIALVARHDRCDRDCRDDVAWRGH
jgi:hypothetical protein